MDHSSVVADVVEDRTALRLSRAGAVHKGASVDRQYLGCCPDAAAAGLIDGRIEDHAVFKVRVRNRQAAPLCVHGAAARGPVALEVTAADRDLDVGRVDRAALTALAKRLAVEDQIADRQRRAALSLRVRRSDIDQGFYGGVHIARAAADRGAHGVLTGIGVVRVV